MTDQQIDARLRAAGERFRTETDAAETVDISELAATPERRHAPRRSHLVLGAAAAAVVALVVALTLALRGSTHPSPPSVDSAGLLGNVWLVSTDGRPSTAALYISRSGVLVADDECRVIGARAAVAGSRLSITDVTVRLKPCTDQYGPGFYDAGTRVLLGSATFHIDDRGMTITHAGVGSLRFVLAPTPIPPPSLDVATLTGTDWVAPSGKILHIDPGTGQLSGGYCRGRATLAGPSVTFENCSSTLHGGYLASVAGATLTLTPAPSHAPFPVKPRPKLRFEWRPLDGSIIDPASLTGRTWHLQTVDGSPASAGSLRIAGGAAVVDDGCATYRRSVQVAAGAFTIAGKAPGHACTDQADTADSFVFNSPAVWTVRDGRLIVYGGGSQAFALVYGSGSGAQDPNLLLGHQWELASITFGTGPYRDGAPSDDPAVLSFTGAGYKLTDVCSVVTGSAQRGNETIDFAGAHVDGHNCPAPLPGSTQGQAAQAIDAILSGEVRWSLDGSTLTLESGAGKLVLTASGDDVAALVGRTWQLTGTQHGSTTSSAIGDVTLWFPDDKTLSITRCYTSQAQVEIYITGVMTVRGLHVTRALPCPSGPPGTQEQNDLIDSVLRGEVAWSIDGDQVMISNSAEALVFTRRP